MTNELEKQIIIDGVDVKKCVYHESGYCTISKEAYCYCCDKPNCHYKNWQRKEQECERLEETFDGLFKVQYKLADNNKKLRQCLTEIKELLKDICIEECCFDWNKTNKKHCGDCDCRFMQLLEKISECEDKND